MELRLPPAVGSTPFGLLSEAFRRIAQDPPADPYELDRFNKRARLEPHRRAVTTRRSPRSCATVDAVLAPSAAAGSASSGRCWIGRAEASDEEADGRRSIDFPAEAEQLELVDEGVEDETLEVGEGRSSRSTRTRKRRRSREVQAEEPASSSKKGVTLSRSNRVVFAEELDELSPGRQRWYRFRLVSSPIELGREAEWQTFKARFAARTTSRRRCGSATAGTSSAAGSTSPRAGTRD